MPHDPARAADTRSWLNKAETDCKAGAFELTAKPPFAADAVFHAQQATEKVLKGYLAWHDIPFRKTHDLAEIGRQCVEIDPSLEPLLVRAARLTEYAWKFRYPGDPDEPSREEAEKALALAREVVDAILARLPPEVRP
jgi:HEPN domain-containing protein